MLGSTWMRPGRRIQAPRWCIGIGIVALAACRPVPHTGDPITGRRAPQLARACPAAPSAPRPWRDEPVSPEWADVTLDFLSERSQRTLETLGLRPAMARLVLARERWEIEGDPALAELVRARQTLTARLNLVDLEIATVAAEADCYEELTESIASSLKTRNESRARAFTAAAISVGAVFGITSGALGVADYERASAGVAIAGGIVEAGLGLGFLWTRGGSVFLPIERNLLHDVWEGPDEPRLFPPTVWGLLQAPRNETRASPREALVERWRASPRLGPVGSAERRERIALLFAPSGGTYDIEALELRIELLDQLEAELNLLSADLHDLLREILAFDPR
jgi:hypothetical protein